MSQSKFNDSSNERITVVDGAPIENYEQRWISDEWLWRFVSRHLCTRSRHRKGPRFTRHSNARVTANLHLY